MPNVKSAIKRNRTNEVKRLRNRMHRNKMRTLIKKLRGAPDRESALKLWPETVSTIDKNVKFGVIHRRTAARYKSRLSHLVAGIGESPAS
ncbi:MAG: 30S ribosomal protein S20 [Candidatus Glassbacteria bacterium]|nr:30S ribosomal protein S20 [Candidatus Glassbacteria bacterium]